MIEDKTFILSIRLDEKYCTGIYRCTIIVIILSFL